MTRTRAEDASSAAVVRDAARAGELDRYLSALLAPRRLRKDLVALTAFLGEIARIPDQVSEPMMGEMRLQWWRDVIEAADADAGASTGSPVADVLVDVMARHALPRELFTDLLEARSRELLPEHLAGGQELDAYLDDTDGAAFRLTARVLGAGGLSGADELLAAAGQAYGRIRLLRGLPAARARGRGLPGMGGGGVANRSDAAWPLLDGARAWLAEARRLVPAAPRGVLPAILPVALVEPYLAALERLGPDIARERADISPLTRVWRLWRASARGRV